jgi:hypothetical protein
MRVRSDQSSCRPVRHYQHDSRSRREHLGRSGLAVSSRPNAGGGDDVTEYGGVQADTGRRRGGDTVLGHRAKRGYSGCESGDAEASLMHRPLRSIAGYEAEPVKRQQPQAIPGTEVAEVVQEIHGEVGHERARTSRRRWRSATETHQGWVCGTATGAEELTVWRRPIRQVRLSHRRVVSVLRSPPPRHFDAVRRQPGPASSPSGGAGSDHTNASAFAHHCRATSTRLPTTP